MILTDESKMPFGKHSKTKTKMANVPARYLLWMYNQPGKPRGAEAEAVRNYTIENLDALKKEVGDD